MKKQILPIIFFIALIGCKKDSIIDPVNPGTDIITATVITDPLNYAPGVTIVKPNATQLNYGAVKVVKGMSLLLNTITPDIMSNSGMHIYLKSGNSYNHLPYTTSGGITYNYALKAAFPYCSVTITRTVGVANTFDDVIVIAAKNSFLQSMSPSLNFLDYNNVKIKLGL